MLTASSQVAAVLAGGRQSFAVGIRVIAHGGCLTGGYRGDGTRCSRASLGRSFGGVAAGALGFAPQPRPRTLTHCPVSTLHALQLGLSGAGRSERLKAMKRTLSIAMGALAIWALMVVAFTQPSANAGPTCTHVGPGLPSQVCTCDIGSHWDAFPGVCEPDADNGSLEPPLLK